MFEAVMKQILLSTAVKEGRHLYNIWKVKKGKPDAQLSAVNFEMMTLSKSDMRYANLENANLKNAQLSKTCLSNANLRFANLKNANLRGANLEFANLEFAVLDGADLEGAMLEGINLRQTRMYGTKGLPSAEKFLSEFEKTSEGIVVWKRIGNATHHMFSKRWGIKAGTVLEETVNPDRGTSFGAGVQFETRKWAQENYNEADLWKCLIRWDWLSDVVIPFGTDGRARAHKLELVEMVKVKLSNIQPESSEDEDEDEDD